MERKTDNEKLFRPSCIPSADLPQRTEPIDVEDIKRDLSAELSVVSSSSDQSRTNSLDSKGHMQVCLRIRPLTLLERENESQELVSLESSTSIVLRPPKTSLSRLSEKRSGQMIQKFTFSQVFGPETTQEEFFEGTMKQPVQDFLDGYNRLIFTYGVTNAGKTYTFQGTEDDLGILPRTMDMLFKSIQGKLYTAMDLKPYRCRDHIKLTKDQVREETAIKKSILCLAKEVEEHFFLPVLTCNILYLAGLEKLFDDSEQSSTSVENYVKFSVWVSFFEIYNECFYDLLVPVLNDKKSKTLRLAQDIKGCSYVKGLQWVQVSDSKEAFRLLKLGLKRQSVASTKLNTYSSRSHSIFTVKILKIEDSGVPRVIRVNELSMCDLAGSERYTKSFNEGERLKESGNINASLLILGKCINALRKCQQSKLQHHIPFRESKLTHYLQGFFTGRGKVHMIVNISQCASMYDETLHVLKFSAIAQKVLVMDATIPPQDHPPGWKSARESLLPSNTKMPIPRKRAAILWDTSLEDVIEDKEMEEQDDISREEEEQEYEERHVLIREEGYMVCAVATLIISLLRLIESLKNKLIAQKKNNLLMELKLREEVTQEFVQCFAQRERHFNEYLSYEQERLEENFERRLEIFKELVNDYIKNADEENRLKDQPCRGQAQSLPGTCDGFGGINDSLQNDVINIKQQAEEAYRLTLSEDPQKATVCLEKQLGETTTELTKTKEELTKKTNDLIKTEELAQKTKGELGDKTVTTTKRKLAEKNPNEVIESSQFKDCEENVLEVKRKRFSENKSTVEEETPKKGTIIIPLSRTETRSCENSSAEIVALKERTKTLEGQLAALEEQCRREKNKKEELSRQITNLNLKLSASEERASHLSEELHQCRADYQKIVSELNKQKTINREQEEKNIQLNNEVEDAKQNIIDKVSQIKTMQSKVDELYKCYLESYAMDFDLVNVKDSLDSQKDEPERAHMSPVCMQSQTASTENLRLERSFYWNIESIWEECKNIIKTSSQKNQQIQELLQQVENLKKGLDDAENYNSQLKMKLNESVSQYHQSIKDKDLINQLQEEIQKKTQDFVKQTAEDHRVIAQFEEEVTTFKQKIRELEGLLEHFRAKDDSITKIEEAVKEKESLILNLESNIVTLQEKCANSDRKLKELNDQKANLEEEVVQLRDSLDDMKNSIQEKEKNEDEQIKSIELLRKHLSETSALVKSLKKDLQRKEEEYSDLKEKFSDAKKQIKQVEKEVCAMRSQEKSLRNENNELHRIKNKFSEELEIKQRTILHLKKQLNNEKLEEISKQYEKTRKDLCAKEKIIEDMRMTLEEQEKNQTEQDQVLEAKIEENNRLVLELEAWKQKYRELNNQRDSDCQEKRSKNEEENINENEELIKLQKELEANEARYQTDRKKWLEEKMRLVSQVKEAESHCNREMRKLAEDRKRHVEQQAEIERLAAQLAEKDSNLQKWREERDKLVEALEVQLKTLASSSIQKDEEIVELKQAALKDLGKELKQRINHGSLQSLAVPLPEGEDKREQSVNKEDHSEIILDSSEVFTENGKTSRFLKPEMEIQFTPLQPSKMEVKHKGSTLTVKDEMLRPKKKRQSEKMDEDFVKSEDKKNENPAMTNSPSTSKKRRMSVPQLVRKEYPLRNRISPSSKKPAKKKHGTLQKIGDFFQSSPTIIHSKAKKLIVTISSAETAGVKENELKPKQAKRRLYSADTSCPVDIPAASVLTEEKEKESDHLISERQLRSKRAK
ncbi:KI20B protein, partial [Syrrhaptes paradoxus]|nr:KI20B protein [Syrrhaptes paradoxus]